MKTFKEYLNESKKDLFINYDKKTGITISTKRLPKSKATQYRNVKELFSGMVAGKAGNCPLRGALDAIQDGSIRTKDDKEQQALEDLHDAIIAHMRSNGQSGSANSYFS